ncbi:Stk1 family PASTA domain-containing Ser/Thr kinase [[Pseudopropionibacterium] massiliense]|uniref:Stk1 family PASTA domain-containing Ser/Thr kinase n=1 Tax=[Pseudopropionibacterium] massiliense TaxID=2220000 RepID=UPI0010304820|nr:Stk1 family PASTA domain-containing Ser/Thr kinase [[Pseudopropionibacterium] massiliense]
MNKSSTYDPMVGSVLDGRYEILAKIARGGMATVYRARDARLQRTVAVKIMRTDLAEDDEFAAKFDREARSAALINHPAVVSIFDQGTSRGQPYIVMEFIDGETLRRLIARDAPLEPVLALDYLEPIASALAAAHDAGIVHRDIKPENVMISTRGHVKVADFGLARQTESPQMTATGVLVGTASYLPPELVTHARPDSRSDIYSTGIVLFELLTGKKPHVGENNYQIAYAHVNVDVPAPSAKLRELGFPGFIPDYLDALVAACTARDPEARIADGRELMDALRQVAGERPGPAQSCARSPAATPARRRQCRHPADIATPRAASTPAEGAPARPRSRSPDTAPAEEGLRPVTAIVAPGPLRSPVSAPSPHSVSPVGAASATGGPPRATLPGSGGGGSPSSHRTPIFPQFSQEPVYRRRRGIMLLVLVLLVTAIIVSVSWWWAEGRFTTTPEVTNIPQEQALQSLRANDLEYTTQEAFSEDVAVGSVISTDPAGNARALRGTKVTVVISKGPERYMMPDVVGQELSQARSAIESAHLVVGQVTEDWSESVETGLIISAGESAGNLLPPGSSIDLVVSKGRQPITIKDHRGTDADQASRELKKQGFAVEVSEEHSDTVPAGQVISQDPADGTGHRGDTVKLVKSLGPEMVTVPDVGHKRTDEAQRDLEAAGFKVEVQNKSFFPAPLGFASGTNPAAGSTAPKGSTVVLYVT